MGVLTDYRAWCAEREVLNERETTRSPTWSEPAPGLGAEYLAGKVKVLYIDSDGDPVVLHVERVDEPQNRRWALAKELTRSDE